MCGIQLYGLCGIQEACRRRSNVSSIDLFVYAALKLLISLLNWQALKDKVGRNIVKQDHFQAPKIL